MSSRAKNLEVLPNELISQCFSHVRKNDVQNLRLVSKHCNAISSPFLISSATVYVTSASLARLEELSSHPVFSQSIKQIDINCSYYDKCMAESRGVYGAHCSFRLYRNLEMYERSGREKRNNPVDESAFFRISEGWSAFNKEGFFDSNTKLTEKQKWLLGVHEQYRNMYEDQERQKIGNGHIQRICTALTRLPYLQSISLSDGPYYPVRRYRHFSDEDVLEQCLLASTWKGSFVTAFLTRPPVEMIPDLFIGLAETNIRPRTFVIDLKPPTDLRCLQLQEPARQAIKTVLSRAQTLSFKMQRWARKDSLAEDNSRPRPEMLALCSLTSAYFESPTIKSLSIAFDEFPAFHEPPTVSISDILPLETQTWPQLHTLSLRYVPLTTADASFLVEKLRAHLKSLRCWCLWVVQGSWVDVVNRFRELDVLHSFEIDYPKGGEISGLPWNHARGFPKREVEEYVLRAGTVNPVLHYLSTTESDP